MLAKSGPLRGQLFAIKIFRRLSKPEWRESFTKEVTFLKKCQHPAVMKVFDEGIYRDQHPFVVAEYLPNTLGNVSGADPRMATKLAYAVQMISALEYLSHPEIAVIHRDIKPANIFIKGGSCVLGDFGLIKRLDVEAEDNREIIKASEGPRMPRNYRTPDLIEYYKTGSRLTNRSDIYQLGLVFAEMFSGFNPQQPMTRGDYTEPIRLDPFKIPGGLGEPIQNAILPMLHEDPNQRPTAAYLMDQWQGLFLEAATRAHALDGRVV